MQCPATSDLEKLLDGGPLAGSSSAICNHISDCVHCQSELDRLCGDSELKPWRTSSSFAASVSTNRLFREALDQAAKLNTDIESQADNSTLPMNSVDPLIALNLKPSEFVGDLGQIGQYRILREIGRGGAAIVFEAIDAQLDRRVAIKLLRPEPQASQAQQRFLREAKAIAQIRHPNVVAIHSIDTTSDNVPLIAMELADGGCLQRRIQDGHGLASRQAAEWIAQVADGLAAVHKIGLIHRDIKPSNVLLVQVETQEIAKLADFGLVRSASGIQRETQTGMLLGTPAYMSPEHLSMFESVDARSDIYSLGATFYECLTGEPPFRGALAAVLKQIEHDEPSPPRKLNSDIPADLETICLKAMERDRGKRYATAEEFSDDIKRWLAGEPIQARPVTSAEKLARWCRRNPGIASLTGAVASLLLLLATGSTFAAFSINGAQQNLRAEKENVEQANRVIQATVADLELQRQIALESLNSLVTKVQTELASRPGTLKLRESILQQALEGLDKVTKNAGALASAHTTIEAHIRKGEILDLLGKTADAIAEFDMAATLARQASDASNASTGAQRDLGNALFMQAEVHRKAFAYDLAEPIYRRVLDIRRAVAEKLHDNSDVQIAMITVQQRLADIHFYRNEWQAAEAAYLQVLQAVGDSVERFPESVTLKRSLAIAHERLGTLATSVGQLDKAQQNFDAVLKLNQSLLAAEPDNGQHRADLAYITKRLASLASVRGDNLEAVRLARDAIDRYVEIAREDPHDTDAQMKVGSGWDTLYEVELAAGHYPAASQAIESSLSVFEKLATSFPTAGKYPSLAMESLIKLAEVQIRLGQWSECSQSLARYSQCFEQYKQTSDANPQLVAATVAWVQRSHAAVKLAIGGLESIEQSSESSADVVYLAKTYVMYNYARVGNVEQAMQLGQSLSDYSAEDILMQCSGWLALSRGYAVCDSTLTAQASERPVAEAASLQATARKLCLESLGALVKVNPASIDYLRKDFDFRIMRDELGTLTSSVKN